MYSTGCIFSTVKVFIYHAVNLEERSFIIQGLHVVIPETQDASQHREIAALTWVCVD